MRNKRAISGRILLGVYLLVAVNCSFSHEHLALFDEACEATHNHDEFESIHHEHHFHVGIFHFLGHLFEELRHVENDNFGDDHLISTPINPIQNSFAQNQNTTYLYTWREIIIAERKIKPLPEPPDFANHFLDDFINTDTPLRAPPTNA